MTYDQDMTETLKLTKNQEIALRTVPDVKIPLFTAATIVGVPARTLQRMEDRGKITSTRLRTRTGRAGERRYSLHDALKLAWSKPEELDNVTIRSTDMDPAERAKVLTADEAAERLGIARDTLHKWSRADIIHPLDWKLDRQSVYSVEDVERVLEGMLT